MQDPSSGDTTRLWKEATVLLISCSQLHQRPAEGSTLNVPESHHTDAEARSRTTTLTGTFNILYKTERTSHRRGMKVKPRRKATTSHRCFQPRQPAADHRLSVLSLAGCDVTFCRMQLGVRPLPTWRLPQHPGSICRLWKRSQSWQKGVGCTTSS